MINYFPDSNGGGNLETDFLCDIQTIIVLNPKMISQNFLLLYFLKIVRKNLFGAIKSFVFVLPEGCKVGLRVIFFHCNHLDYVNSIYQFKLWFYNGTYLGICMWMLYLYHFLFEGLCCYILWLVTSWWPATWILDFNCYEYFPVKIVAKI